MKVHKRKKYYYCNTMKTVILKWTNRQARWYCKLHVWGKKNERKELQDFFLKYIIWCGRQHRSPPHTPHPTPARPTLLINIRLESSKWLIIVNCLRFGELCFWSLFVVLCFCCDFFYYSFVFLFCDVLWFAINVIVIVFLFICVCLRCVLVVSCFYSVGFLLLCVVFLQWWVCCILKVSLLCFVFVMMCFSHISHHRCVVYTLSYCIF